MDAEIWRAVEAAGMTAVTPETLAVRRAFAEIAGEDPRSYEAEIRRREERQRPAPVRRRGRSLVEAIAERLTEDKEH